MSGRAQTSPPRSRLPACLALCAALAFLLAGPRVSSARAEFGLLPGAEGFNVSIDGEGEPGLQAGSHPDALSAEIGFNPATSPFPDGDVRDLSLALPPGLIENPTAPGRCTQAQFNIPRSSPFEAESLSGESCPDASQVGVIAIGSSFAAGSVRTFGVFNLDPPPGAPYQLGFAPFGSPIVLTPHLRDADAGYGITLDSRDLPQLVGFQKLELTLWGTPWDPNHDARRGNCLNEAEPQAAWGQCSVGPNVGAPKAYLTLPDSCSEPLRFSLSAEGWQQPGSVSTSAIADDGHGQPLSLEGCDRLHFLTTSSVAPTNFRASTSSGLDFDLDVDQEGLLKPGVLAPSQVRDAVVTLPEGMTLNPSLGAGLGVCTPVAYAAETVSSAPGAGCPNAAKIGDFTLRSPLFEGRLEGSIFLAEPDDPTSAAPGAENPFDSLLAVYLVAKAPDRGLLVKLAGKLSADPTTGRLVANFEDLPQLPYTNLQVHFREGQRAPLVTPPICATYSTRVALTAWLDPDLLFNRASEFTLLPGEGKGCPSGPVAPFEPHAQAGTLNSNAGSYSPLYLHFTRTDPEQEITSYSAQLPPGLLGNLSGIPYCPEADIAAAKLETGVGEEAHPSCPAASQIGHTYSGYGVGGVLAYAPGRLYLAGPYHGAPLSILAVDSATVGPFDLGTILIRSAIDIDPRSARVSIDSAASDPIPHIRDGIPLRLRDVRVYIDRPEFTLNPTSCEPFLLTSVLTGSGARFSDPSDDVTAAVGDHFQAFGCAERPFAPRLNLRLKGGTQRGDYPSLRATVTPRAGDANLGSAAVTLPPSEFLAQNHIGTVCTRPQLEAEACPAGSVYGHATAVTPLLEEPMTGNVYLRSSSNLLPDLVTVLHGRGIRIVLEGRIDSSQGGLRGTFVGLPDAPLTKFTIVLSGGKRGLLVNERNLCAAPQLASARLLGQNNRGEALHPRLGVKCPKQKRGKGDHKPSGRRVAIG